MVCWICGSTITYHKLNVAFRRFLSIASTSKKIRKGCLFDMDMLGANVTMSRLEGSKTYWYWQQKDKSDPSDMG